MSSSSSRCTSFCRGISPAARSTPGVIDYKPLEKAAGQAVRQKALIRQGIDRELAKRLVKEIKDGKFKVQVTVQGDELGCRARSATTCRR